MLYCPAPWVGVLSHGHCLEDSLPGEGLWFSNDGDPDGWQGSSEVRSHFRGTWWERDTHTATPWILVPVLGPCVFPVPLYLCLQNWRWLVSLQFGCPSSLCSYSPLHSVSRHCPSSLWGSQECKGPGHIALPTAGEAAAPHGCSLGPPRVSTELAHLKGI